MRHLLQRKGEEYGAPTAGQRLETRSTYCGGEVRNMEHLLQRKGKEHGAPTVGKR